MAPRKMTREDLAAAAQDDLAAAIRAALGSDRTIKEVTRLAGGTTKGVYRLTLDDGTTVIAYLWRDSENYWPQAPNENDAADPFSPGNSIGLYATAHSRLASLGLRVPEIYLLDRDRAYYPADIAILEDFPGENLLAFWERDPVAAEPTLARLRAGLAAMRDYRGRAPGKVSFIDDGGTPRWPTSEEAVLALGLRCVAEAAERDRRIAGIRERLKDRLRELAAAVRPRAEYSVVHGELGLDHVLVDADGNPVIIDIEDLMYFDVEWEHVHMQVRLGHDWAGTVGVDDLDGDRLALYMLAQRLFLVAGPMRLLAGDFPDKAFMRSIIEHNLNGALALLP
jgi:Phosphotransferase enzyme family